MVLHSLNKTCKHIVFNNEVMCAYSVPILPILLDWYKTMFKVYSAQASRVFVWLLDLNTGKAESSSKQLE